MSKENKCQFCGDSARNTYETESVFKIRACNKKACKKKALAEASKWRR